MGAFLFFTYRRRGSQVGQGPFDELIQDSRPFNGTKVQTSRVSSAGTFRQAVEAVAAGVRTPYTASDMAKCLLRFCSAGHICQFRIVSVPCFLWCLSLSVSDVGVVFVMHVVVS